MNKKIKTTIKKLFLLCLVLIMHYQKPLPCRTILSQTMNGASHLLQNNRKAIVLSSIGLIGASLILWNVLKNKQKENEINDEDNHFNSLVPELIIQNEIKQRPRSNSCINFTTKESQKKSHISNNLDLIMGSSKNSQENHNLHDSNIQNNLGYQVLKNEENQDVSQLYLSQQQISNSQQQISNLEEYVNNEYKGFNLHNINHYSNLFFTPQQPKKNPLNESMLKNNVQSSESVIKNKIKDYFNIVQKIVESSEKIPINPKFTLEEKFISVIFTKDLLAHTPEILNEIIESLDITNNKEEKQPLILKPFLVWLNNYYQLWQKSSDNCHASLIKQAILNIQTIFTHMYTNTRINGQMYSVQSEYLNYPKMFSCMLENAQKLAFINHAAYNLQGGLDNYNYEKWFGENNELIEIAEEGIKVNTQNTMNENKQNKVKEKNILEKAFSWFNSLFEENDNKSKNKNDKKNKTQAFITLFENSIEYEGYNLELYMKLNHNNTNEGLIQTQLIKINTIMKKYLELLNIINCPKDPKKIALTDKISKNITYMNRDERIKIPLKERREMLKKIKAEKLGNRPPLCKWFEEGAHHKALENVKNGKHVSKDDNNVKYDASQINDNKLSDYAVWIWQLNNTFKDNKTLSEVFEAGAFKEILRKEDELDEEYDFVQ